MTAKKNGKTKISTQEKVGLGIGLTAAAVAAAGAYFLYGSKNAAQNRKKVKGWTLKAKGEVLEALEKAEQITENEYAKLVETASKAYGTVQRATKGEVSEFKREMQQHWNELQANKAVKKIADKATATVGKKLAAKKTSTSSKRAAKAASKSTSKTSAAKKTA